MSCPDVLKDIREIPNIRIEALYATPHNFMGQAIDGYAGNLLWIHEKGAEFLSVLAQKLQGKGLGLHVWDAYRPIRATNQMVHWAESTNRQYLLDEGYLVRRSRHNSGGAIDLSLYDLERGQLLDMGTEWDEFSEASHTFQAKGQALINRLFLRTEMEHVGFVPYDVEWWHFEIPNAVDLPRWDEPYPKE